MNWDKYFYELCKVVGSNSKCLSRRIGAVLVKDNNVIATGYNGPPRGIPECAKRYELDKTLVDNLFGKEVDPQLCPRKNLGFASGEGLEWCVAIHAEKNCLLSAARQGISTKGATMYLDAAISPCSQCFGAMINAGVKEIVLLEYVIYDKAVQWLIDNNDINMRTFKL